MLAVVNSNFLDIELFAYSSFINANEMADYGIEMIEFERLSERSDGFDESCVSSVQLHRTTIDQLSGRREGLNPNVNSGLTFRPIAVSPSSRSTAATAAIPRAITQLLWARRSAEGCCGNWTDSMC